MDDLDHSIHIAEYEWTSFYEESEECIFQRPSLAGFDNLSLSDSEDSGNPVCPVLDTGQLDEQQNPVVNTDTIQPGAVGLGKTEDVGADYSQLSMQISFTRGGQASDLTLISEDDAVILQNATIPDSSLELHQDSEVGLPYHGENIPLTETAHVETEDGIAEVTDHSMTEDIMLIAECHESAYAQSSARDASTEEDFKHTGEGPPASLTHQHENDSLYSPLSNMNSTATAVAEKERWFVTITESPSRHQAKTATSTKKKRRKKKPLKNSNHLRISGWAPLPESDPEEQRDKTFESDIEKIDENFTNSCQSSEVQSHVQLLPVSSQKELISEPPEIFRTSSPFSEEDDMSTNLSLDMSHFTQADCAEAYMNMNNNTQEIYCTEEMPENITISAYYDIFTLRDENTLPQCEVESEDLEDSVEFFSSNSFDSEYYLSATDSSAEESLPITNGSLYNQQNGDMEDSQGGMQSLSDLLTFPEVVDVHPSDIQNMPFSTVSHTVRSTSMSTLEKSPAQVHMPQQSECYEDKGDQAYAKPAMTFPSSSQSTDRMPQDSSALDEEKHLTSHESFETPEHVTGNPPTDSHHQVHSDLVMDQPQHPLIPQFTVTPCSDTPETYVDPHGPTRPVYAISAFWDEMEKLTIKDILQLRTARTSPPKEKQSIQEMPTPQGDGTDTQTTSSVNTVESLLPCGVSVDTSDTADSDYFTQLDDSKPDRSSCEFSISDFGEEYWQFIDTSRNPTPEPQELKKQGSQRTDNSPCSIHDLQEDDTECTEAPAEVDEFEQCFEDHTKDIFVSNKPLFLGTITKSKTIHNVQALDTEFQKAPSESFLERRFHSNSPTLKENTCGVLRQQTPPPILSYTDILDENYQISFPEVFEYLFTEDEQNNLSKTVTVSETALSWYGYGSLVPPLQYSQGGGGRPIPIFSCKHPPVRDLTFPELDYLLIPQDPCAESEEEDDYSPIRIVSRSHIQASDLSYTVTVPDASYLNRKGWARSWKRFLSFRKISLSRKGRDWCRRSGAWVAPVEGPVKMPAETSNQNTALSRRVASFPFQIFSDSAVQQRLIRSAHKTLSLSKQDGLLSTLRQSDMCLVCIAVASWVLRSSDPHAADTWKAALLANVSAISAIQYLRQFVKTEPPGDKA